MLEVGDILVCKRQFSSPVGNWVFTKGDSYKIDSILNGIYTIGGCVFGFSNKDDDDYFSLYEFFYTPSEMRLKKLKTIV